MSEEDDELSQVGDAVEAMGLRMERLSADLAADREAIHDLCDAAGIPRDWEGVPHDPDPPSAVMRVQWLAVRAKNVAAELAAARERGYDRGQTTHATRRRTAGSGKGGNQQPGPAPGAERRRMKLGTAKFVGSRLREAREARALSAVALSDLLGVSRQAVSQYEGGTKTPSPEVMDRIVQVLDIPHSFFLREVLPEQRGTLFYRSMSSATKAARARAERRYGWLRYVVSRLVEYVEFPPVKFPRFTEIPADPYLITAGQIEWAASQVRRHWGLGDGPISNVAWLLENNGAIVTRKDLAADTLDAFSEWDPQLSRPFVVLGNDKRSAARSRFDAAHELGHLVLHRDVQPAAVRLPQTFRLIEDQAHAFAGAFLLPAQTFSSEVYSASLDVFRSMKSRWKVAIGVMIKRAAQLELIDPEQERRLWINRARRGWTIREPLDDVLEPEEPRFLKRSIDMLIEKGGLSAQELAIKLCLRIGDVEDVCGLRPRYLAEQDDQSIKLRQPSDPPPPSPWRQSTETGNWIFPTAPGATGNV